MIKLLNKTKDVQLDLLEAAPAPIAPPAGVELRITTSHRLVPSAPQLLPIAALKRRATALGFQINPNPVPA